MRWKFDAFSHFKPANAAARNFAVSSICAGLDTVCASPQSPQVGKTNSEARARAGYFPCKGANAFRSVNGTTGSGLFAFVIMYLHEHFWEVSKVYTLMIAERIVVVGSGLH